MPNVVVSKTIIKKTTGKVSVTSFGISEKLAEKASLFGIYIHIIIDGAAEALIQDKKYMLRTGNSIVIPAHAAYCINAHELFKMILTVIKSG